MQNQYRRSISNKLGLLTYLILLTGIFILLEISFFLQCSGLYLGDFKLIANHLAVPSGVIPGILYFITAQLLLHFFFMLLPWVMARLTKIALNLSETKTEILGIVLWFAALFAVLFANGIFFPNSKYAEIFSPLLTSITVMKILLSVCLFVLATFFLLAFYGLFKYSRRLLLLCTVFSAVTYAFGMYQHTAPFDPSTAEKPNIIIIGVDSLRPDFLHFFGSSLQTPHFDYFLNRATVFSESLTALARTFPSWVTILTGQYPKKNGIRTNLDDPKHLNRIITLPSILKQHGYTTIFATDESRFSNIDQSYGFDHIITPPIGFNDFLLGTVNDFPISNIIINTAMGRYLFPYSYANRPVYFTYDPNSFLKLLSPVLSQSRLKPVLLVTHFCLPHYPYGWSALTAKKITISHYQSAIHRVDQQFHDYMLLLKNNHFLDHAIVILLSDHGEALELHGDRITDPALFASGKKSVKIPQFYPSSAYHEKVDQSGGHGTDVLGLTQYHTVLAVRTFGVQSNQQKIIPGRVSLMDIKPTVMDLLHIPSGTVNGKSLREYIVGHQSSAKIPYDFFTESDFTPEAVRTAHPEAKKVLFEGIDYFRIDPKTTRVLVRDKMYQMILSSKQYADYYGDWVLALYPQSTHAMTPILVNLRTRRWTNDLHTSFAAEAPTQHMLTALHQFFGADITTIKS